MKKFILLTGVLLPAFLVGAVLEDFSYADSAALQWVWSGFGGDNPAPSATSIPGGMLLKSAGGAGDKVIVRDFFASPGSRISFQLEASAENAPGSYAYVALRRQRDGANLVLDSVPLVPGKTSVATIENGGRFQWFDRFSMLICLHDAGKPMTLTVRAIQSPGADVPMPFRDTPDKRRLRREKVLNGRTVQIDTGFPYYQNRSAESIAEELRVNGFDAVYYYVIHDTGINPPLIDALKRRDIAVGLMTLPSLVYWSEEQLAGRLPGNWRNWLMKFTGHEMDLYRFIGFVHPEYNIWYKQYLNAMLKNYGFDVFTFAEIMYPIYDGPARAKVFYGDVSPAFQAAFKRATGHSSFPNFTDPADPDYFKTNTELYRELVEYRVRTINDFYDDVINSPDGARKAAPDILFATWTLGINIPDGVGKLREWEGNDIGAMIRQVKPDLHFIQTHAPDWANPALAADYPLAYAPFFDAIRKVSPDIRIGMQADFGSNAVARRNPAWVRMFYETCRKAGVGTTTWYEFSLRHDVYAAAPKLMEARRTAAGIRLIFDQRLGAGAVAAMNGRTLKGNRGEYRVQAVRLDGNCLDLTTAPLPQNETNLTIPTGGIPDDPAVRFPASHLEPMPRGPVNVIAADSLQTIPLLKEENSIR